MVYIFRSATTFFLTKSQNLNQTFAPLPNFEELESNIESENIQMNLIQGEEEHFENEEKNPEFPEDENLPNPDLDIESYLSIDLNEENTTLLQRSRQTPQSFKCSVCRKSLPTKAFLLRHIDKAHGGRLGESKF